MKKSLFLYLLSAIVLLFSQKITYSQIWAAEIRIDNKWSYPVNILLSPYSAIFNGHYTPDNFKHIYTFKRSKTAPPSGNWEYVVGSQSNFTNVAVNDYRLVDFDDGLYNSVNPNQIIGGIGPGLWRLQFTNVPNDDSDPLLIEECFLDYRDANFGTYAANNFTHDLYFELKYENNQTKLYFKFDGGNWVDIHDNRIDNKTIKLWHQVGRWMNGYGNDPVFPGSPNKGNFKSTNINNGEFLNFPLLATNYNGISHVNSNLFWASFSLLSGHNGKVLEGKTIYIENGAKFIVSDNAVLTFQNNSTLYIKNGGKFCNYGTVKRYCARERKYYL